MTRQKTIEEMNAGYKLFLDIQMGKYLKSMNKAEFDSDEEAANVIKKIVNEWNNSIADKHAMLDNSDLTAKTSWFNSVNIDFKKSAGMKTMPGTTKEIQEETKEMISHYNEIFPYLPEGAVLLLLFAGPAMEAYGYPLERFNKLVNGEEPTEIEIDLLRWAYDIALLSMSAFMEKIKSKKKKYLEKSIDIAAEELDKETALGVVHDIYENIEEHFADIDVGEKRKSPKKKKKKKK
jgi:hypothetical protein